MAETTRTKRSPLGWVKKHKVLTAVLLVVVLVAVLVLRAVLGAKKAAGTTYQYVRTTILQKTSLTDSVSVNGTVQSSDKASVTAADGVKTYKVTTVNVAVGDTVKKGDVIRATADLTQGIETSSDSDIQMMDDGSFYVGDGENMPDGVTIARTDDAGGPGGGGPGGAPDGGPGGQ